jgi:antitoxin Phd
MKGVLNMTVNTNTLVAMTEANQNFSKVTRLVDDEGIAVILKNNKPRYIVVNFDEYDEIRTARENRKKMIDAAADELIRENMDALLELAK